MKYFLWCCLWSFGTIWSQKIQTVTYYSNDTLSLQMDIYRPEKNIPNKAVVLHMHGGGFSGGDRKQEANYCRYLAKNGILAVSMSYTLYMKGKKFSCDGILTEKVKAFQHGVSNLWLATNYLLEEQNALGINPKLIFTSGISAGAEAILHGAFWNQDAMNLYKNRLPNDFKYAGVISGAGAIMDINLITKNNVVPMLLFHGSEDVTVPYGTAPHHLCAPGSSGYLMLFGSYSIFEHVKSLNATVELFTYCGGNHGYSSYLIEKHPEEILRFITQVQQNKKWQRHEIYPTKDTGPITKNFNFCH